MCVYVSVCVSVCSWQMQCGVAVVCVLVPTCIYVCRNDCVCVLCTCTLAVVWVCVKWEGVHVCVCVSTLYE